MKSKALAFGLGLAVGVAAMILYGLAWDDRDQALYVARERQAPPWTAWPS